MDEENKIRCPNCNSSKMKKYESPEERPVYVCQNCGEEFDEDELLIEEFYEEEEEEED